jgi:hypothetical protein
MRIGILALAAAMTPFVLVQTVEAQTYSRAPRQGAYQAADPYVCRKACQNDFAPCDPEYMKHADGRCTGIATGIGR